MNIRIGAKLFIHFFKCGSPVVYKKGVIILHKIAEQIGTENYLALMKCFYQQYNEVPYFSYDDFLNHIK